MVDRSKPLRRLLIGYILLLFGTLPVAYPIWTTYLRDSVGRFITVEQIHFIEYIGLGMLVGLHFKSTFQNHALPLTLHPLPWKGRGQGEGKRTFSPMIALTAILGFLDETVQALLPNRYFQWSDVLLNWAGSLLGWLIAGLRWRWPRSV